MKTFILIKELVSFTGKSKKQLKDEIKSLELNIEQTLSCLDKNLGNGDLQSKLFFFDRHYGKDYYLKPKLERLGLTNVYLASFLTSYKPNSDTNYYLSIGKSKKIDGLHNVVRHKSYESIYFEYLENLRLWLKITAYINMIEIKRLLEPSIEQIIKGLFEIMGIETFKYTSKDKLENVISAYTKGLRGKQLFNKPELTNLSYGVWKFKRKDGTSKTFYTEEFFMINDKISTKEIITTRILYNNYLIILANWISESSKFYKQ